MLLLGIFGIESLTISSGGGTLHGSPVIPDSQSNHSKVNAIK